MNAWKAGAVVLLGLMGFPASGFAISCGEAALNADGSATFRCHTTVTFLYQRLRKFPDDDGLRLSGSPGEIDNDGFRRWDITAVVLRPGGRYWLWLQDSSHNHTRVELVEHPREAESVPYSPFAAKWLVPVFPPGGVVRVYNPTDDRRIKVIIVARDAEGDLLGDPLVTGREIVHGGCVGEHVPWRGIWTWDRARALSNTCGDVAGAWSLEVMAYGWATDRPLGGRFEAPVYVTAFTRRGDMGIMMLPAVKLPE